MRFPRAVFERLAEKALREIPRRFLDLIVDLTIEVKSRPGPEAGRWKGSNNLLGLYHGLRRADMMSPYSGTHPPARIVLYQKNIETLCRDEADLAGQIRTTLRHELAHHFGFTDEELRLRWPEGASQ